jgi:hypothetical protein
MQQGTFELTLKIGKKPIKIQDWVTPLNGETIIWDLLGKL